MLGTLILNNIKNQIKNHEQIEKHKKLKRLKKLEQKNEIVRLFGKTRYRLSYWFGAWCLYSFNHRDYSPVLYQKFYKQLSTANQYAEKLQEKYTKVQLEEVYNKDGMIIGYLLYGKGEKIDDSQQHSNVIPFSIAKKIQ